MAWLAYHLYYHESLNRAVLGFVHPAVSDLLQRSWIDSFFFVRYGLGGPHIRLRVRALPGCESLGAEAIRSTAAAFLARSPSTASLTEEEIRGTNRAILASDPHETDDSVYPDNTLLSFPFHPEIHRYGGPSLLPASLEFFAFSSLSALEFLLQHGEESRQRQFVVALCLLLRQALSFAVDEEEMLSLANYGVESWGETLTAIVAKGDRVFAGQRETFFRLFRQELETIFPTGDNLLAEAAHQLSREIGASDRQTRKRIGISQLHMTATRIGLINPEETYISRLMANTIREILAAEPGIRYRLKEVWDGPVRIGGLLRDVLFEAFLRLPVCSSR